MILRLALLAVVCDIFQVLSEDAHADANVVLPGAAVLAADPGLVLGITLLTCGTAYTTYELFLLGLWL